MKRRSKEAIRSKVAEQIKEMQHSESTPTDTRTGREQLQSVLAPDIITLPAREGHKPESKPGIVLYLRDGVNPADKNFTKYPNEMHGLMTERLTEYESLLYIKFWRESWGYGKNYCRIGYSALLRETALRSKSTVTRAVVGLREKRFIVLALDEASSPKTTQIGTIYRVFAPCEILDGKTEEGIVLQSIPTAGILCRTMPNKKLPEEAYKQGHNTGISKESIPRQRILTEKSGQSDDTVVVSQGVVTKNTPANSGHYRVDRYTQREYTQREGTFKEDNLKDSLSPRVIISGFYNKIGQTKTSKEKRERAEIDFKELQKDGFDPEDIQFAVEWTVENAKEQPYDFSIIKHTIGQAMAAKKRTEGEKGKQLEEERLALENQVEEERQAEEQKKMKALKEALDPEDKAKLRERALKEIRNMEGIREAFINDILISTKENEILKSEMQN